MRVPTLCCSSASSAAVIVESQRTAADRNPRPRIVMEAFKRLNLEGKVAIVTGSSAGIGKTTALLMAARGAKLTLHGRRADKLAEVAAEIEAISGHKSAMVIGDIEDSGVRAELIDQTISTFGQLDILVNNAGWMKIATLENTSLEDVRTMLEVHVVGPFELCKLAAPELEKTKGNIVNVSSICGQQGFTFLLAYTAAKAGMDNMTRSLAGTFGPKGVRINCVSPGQVMTELLRVEADLSYIQTHAGEANIPPIGRLSQPGDIAELICFLASDAASMITGAVYTIDGGSTTVAM